MPASWTPISPTRSSPPRRALAQLGEIRRHRLHAGHDINVVDRPTALQRAILDAFGVDTTGWNKAKIA